MKRSQVMALLLLCLIAWTTPQGSNDYPHADEFARRVRKGLQLDHESLKGFTYVERRRDVKISKLGKVTIGSLRTFEVYPSEQPGQNYKRLIAVDGKPLTANELAERDAEHQRDLAKEAEKVRTESPRQRHERLREIEEDTRHREQIWDDVVAVYAPTFVGRDVIDGKRILVADLNPRSDARVATREGRWMKYFAGRVWIDEADHQIVKLDMKAFEDLTIGWGIVGRLHKGSRLVYARRQFDGAWLPAELTYQATGRTLLFRPFEFAVTTTYSDYRRRQ
jgi:hypothetical protein